MSSAATPLLHKSHVVSSDDYCSGYVDAFGKWNTGFQCPWTDVPHFCCGTDTFKYCCTGQEKATASAASLEDPLLLVLAITLGVAAGVTLLTLVACFVCPGCLLHKKRRPGPMYRLPCSSTMSSYATTANTSATTNAPEASRMCSSSAPYPHCGAVPSLYSSLSSDPLCHSGPGNEMLHHHQHQQQRQQHPQQQLPLRDDSQRQSAFHYLYWNRDSPSGVAANPARMHHQGPQHHPLLRHYQGGREGDGSASPPPPYEANFQPTPVARSSAAARVAPAIRPGAAVAHGRPRPTAQEAIVRHISPRQPAVCIIEDGHRDDHPDGTHRSTKF